MSWDDEKDHELMSQVILYNPWARGHNWVTFHSSHMAQHITLGPAQVPAWKSFYDRAKLLMERRKAEVAQELKKSGNDDVKDPTDYQKAVDDAIELAGGQEQSEKKKVKLDHAAVDIRMAAMETEVQGQGKVEKATEPPVSRRPQNSIGDALAASVNLRKEQEARKDREREQERRERQQERELERIERERERKMKEQETEQERKEREQERKEEREIRRRELDLQEKSIQLRDRELRMREEQEKAVQAQNAAMMSAIATLLEKVKKE